MDTGQTNSDSKHATRFTVILIVCVVAAFISAGVIAYATTKNNANKSTADFQKSGSSATRSFAAVPNARRPLTATLATIIPGQTTISRFQSDGHGTFSQIDAFDGKTVTTIYTPDSYYICRDSYAARQCVKHPNDPTVSNLDPTGFTFSSAKINQLRTTAKYDGKQKCPDGRSACDVWFTTTQYNTRTYYYVDTATGLIMQTIHNGRFGQDKESAKVTLKNTYTYKSVHISVPTDYTDAPKQQ